MQCGTKPDMNGKFYENNIVIQYDKDLIEVWDEAKRLRCEWYNDYEKGITKPPIRVSDLEVVELNFRGKFGGKKRRQVLMIALQETMLTVGWRFSTARDPGLTPWRASCPWGPH